MASFILSVFHKWLTMMKSHSSPAFYAPFLYGLILKEFDEFVNA